MPSASVMFLNYSQLIFLQVQIFYILLDQLIICCVHCCFYCHCCHYQFFLKKCDNCSLIGCHNHVHFAFTVNLCQSFFVLRLICVHAHSLAHISYTHAFYISMLQSCMSLCRYIYLVISFLHNAVLLVHGSFIC